MRIQVSSVAEAEITAALEYYESESPGLGADLLSEYEMALSRIRMQPEAWRRIGSNSRRCLLRRFPYGIVYSSTPSQITITAFMALRRDPNRWEDRID